MRIEKEIVKEVKEVVQFEPKVVSVIAVNRGFVEVSSFRARCRISSTESRARCWVNEQRFCRHDYHTQLYPKKAAMLSRFLDAARACVRSLFGLVHRLLRPTTVHCTLHPFAY